MTTLSSIIDHLGTVQAQIADLRLKEKELKDVIALAGEGAHDGALFRATVSISDRETLDMKAVRAHLSHQFIAAHTKVTTGIVTVACKARKTAALSVAA